MIKDVHLGKHLHKKNSERDHPLPKPTFSDSLLLQFDSLVLVRSEYIFSYSHSNDFPISDRRINVLCRCIDQSSQEQGIDILFFPLGLFGAHTTLSIDVHGRRLSAM